MAQPARAARLAGRAQEQITVLLMRAHEAAGQGQGRFVRLGKRQRGRRLVDGDDHLFQLYSQDKGLRVGLLALGPRHRACAASDHAHTRHCSRRVECRRWPRRRARARRESSYARPIECSGAVGGGSGSALCRDERSR